MQEWTDGLSIPLPSGKTVADVVDLVLGMALGGASAAEMCARLVADIGLSAQDAELAVDRSFGGLVRARTSNPANCPPRAEDPVAWVSFQRGTRDPSLVARLYPAGSRVAIS